MNAKKVSKPSVKKKAAATPSPPTEPTHAMVHDLLGAAFLILPKTLRNLIGDQALQANAQELQDREILVIVREPGVVAYVHLPIIALEMDGDLDALDKGGLTLHAITGDWSTRLKDRSRATDLVAVIEAAGKGGRHA